MDEVWRRQGAIWTAGSDEGRLEGPQTRLGWQLRSVAEGLAGGRLLVQEAFQWAWLWACWLLQAVVLCGHWGAIGAAAALVAVTRDAH